MGFVEMYDSSGTYGKHGENYVAVVGGWASQLPPAEVHPTCRPTHARGPPFAAAEEQDIHSTTKVV